MVHVTKPRPFQFQGWFAVHGLAIATVNLPTKSEGFISFHSFHFIYCNEIDV